MLWNLTGTHELQEQVRRELDISEDASSKKEILGIWDVCSLTEQVRTVLPNVQQSDLHLI